jgi:hypothetical protein
MHHHYFKYIRNTVFIIVALMMAGYPYLIYAGYFYEDDGVFIMRSALVVAVLLISFGLVAYAAHKEYEKRKKESMIPDGFEK